MSSRGPSRRSSGELLVQDEPGRGAGGRGRQPREDHPLRATQARAGVGGGMGAQLRAVRRRIRSIKSTAKITRAQEMIATSRILKAQQRVQAAGPYAREITRAVEAVVSRSHVDQPPADDRASKPVARRDPAAYQRPRLLRRVQRERAARNAGSCRAAAGPGQGACDVRGRQQRASSGTVSVAMRWRRNGTVFPTTRGTITPGRSPPKVARGVWTRLRTEGGVDEIHLVYTEFVSMLTQTPQARRILPLEIEETTEPPPEGAGAGIRVRALARGGAGRAASRPTWRAGCTTRCSRPRHPSTRRGAAR